jgi:hypothetical protein
MGNHLEHALVIFNRIAHKVVKDTISYRIQANNQYCKENEKEVGFFNYLLN